MFRIVNGFTEMSDGTLLVKANLIRTSLTGNTSFPTPTPSLAALTTAITDFEAAVLAAENGDRQLVAVKNQLREVLINLLHLLGNYVLFTAGGDEVVATSSGFNVSKVPQPSPALTTPQGMELKNGVNKGELQFSFRKVRGARAYIFEITPLPVTGASLWQSSMGTICKKLFTGLESGKEYACRVAAIGIKDQVVYSNPVTRVAL